MAPVAAPILAPLAEEPPQGLTPQQFNEWKRQQRLIKNREAATISRQRRKDYVANLEAKCRQLEEEKSRLESENGNLRNDNQRLLNEVKKTLEFSTIFNNFFDLKNSAIKSLLCRSKSDEGSKVGVKVGRNLRWSKTASKASVCLMAVLMIFTLSFSGKFL